MKSKRISVCQLSKDREIIDGVASYLLGGGEIGTDVFEVIGPTLAKKRLSLIGANKPETAKKLIKKILGR